MIATIPTEQEIRTALHRDSFYGQIAVQVMVPPGYDGPDSIDGVPVEIDDRTSEAYVVPAEGGRLRLDGREMN